MVSQDNAVKIAELAVQLMKHESSWKNTADRRRPLAERFAEYYDAIYQTVTDKTK